MQHNNDFRLSELYLACRTLGARHVLTHEVLNLFAMLANPDFTQAVMGAQTIYGDGQIIPFRRNPIDLRFVCALVGSTGKAAREGFIVCSDEALGFIGSLRISSDLTPQYSLEEKPRQVAILEEHDVFRALSALSLPDINQAYIQADTEKPDVLHIALPAGLPNEGPDRKALKPQDAFKFRIYPNGAAPEVLTQIKLIRTDAQQVSIKIAAEHLMVCHNAGLQGLAFDLITPDFALDGRFPDMLDTLAPQCVRHSPVGLFHSVFKGLDDHLMTLPDDIAHALRAAVHWLNQPEFAT